MTRFHSSPGPTTRSEQLSPVPLFATSHGYDDHSGDGDLGRAVWLTNSSHGICKSLTSANLDLVGRELQFRKGYRGQLAVERARVRRGFAGHDATTVL